MPGDVDKGAKTHVLGRGCSWEIGGGGRPQETVWGVALGARKKRSKLGAGQGGRCC